MSEVFRSLPSFPSPTSSPGSSPPASPNLGFLKAPLPLPLPHPLEKHSLSGERSLEDKLRWLSAEHFGATRAMASEIPAPQPLRELYSAVLGFASMRRRRTAVPFRELSTVEIRPATTATPTPESVGSD
eukprot:RCo012519